jgi:hypothetical protein
MLNTGLEMCVEEIASGRAAAWFPATLHPVARVPNQSTWAGAASNHPHILAFEGDVKS